MQLKKKYATVKEMDSKNTGLNGYPNTEGIHNMVRSDQAYNHVINIFRNLTINHLWKLRKLSS
jgi:hypothetical protein